ncbi:MAG TPA: type II 3-dehydroquinate dehydratase [Pseudomonadales bacterium]
MKRVLVIQGAGMDQRGKVQVDIFGPETLAEINAQIERHGARLGLDVEIFQSNDATEVCAKLNAARGKFAALIINPAGFTVMEGPLPNAIVQLGFPAYEVHASNPSARGIRSVIQPVCKGAICGFGYRGYAMALAAIKELPVAAPDSP